MIDNRSEQDWETLREKIFALSIFELLEDNQGVCIEIDKERIVLAKMYSDDGGYVLEIIDANLLKDDEGNKLRIGEKVRLINRKNPEEDILYN